MKKIFIFLIIISSISCRNYPEQIVVPMKGYDSTLLANNNLKNLINILADSCKSYRLELSKIKQKINDTTFILNYKIQKCFFYSDIVAKNPSQAKFFRGWINRAIK